MGDARRILIVEDEPIVAIALQDMLEALGYEVAGPAFRVAPALALAAQGGFDAAILDVNMGDGESYCVADRLKAAGIPYLFATGYGREGLAAGHEEAIVLRKPYREADIAEALAALLR